jgi:hypothetical protein
LAINNDYTFSVPQGTTEIPQITATATDSNASVVITQATSIPGDATVVVTSQNGLVVNTYTVAFSFAIPTEPMTAAPTPTANAANVISLFSNAYTNVAIDTWQTPWSAGVLTDLQIEGNDTKRYTNLNFVGVEMTGANSLDASTATSFNMDVWTPNMTQLRIKLVDFGPNNAFQGGDDTEHEIIIENPTQGQWVTLNIDMDDFVNLTGRANISQLIISGNPAGAGTLFVDNVYFGIPSTVIVPTTQLRPEFCDFTLPTLYSNFFANTVQDATAYKFRVVNGMNEQEIELSDVRFSMEFVEAVMLGTTYEISVAAQVSGVWGDYGTVCSVTTPSNVPSSKLRDQFCNTTLSNFNSNIYADIVVEATAYKFKVVNGMNEQEIERTDSRFSMSFVTGIMPGMTYQVSVAVEFNGVWGDYGAVCNVTTPMNIPTSQLRSQFCGNSVSGLGSNFYAVVRVGATGYKFKTMINGEEVEVERTDSRCFMSAFPGAILNQNYSIQVAVQIGGVWGEYGPACNLLVGTTGKLLLTDETETFDIKAYPNPFTSQIMLTLAAERTQSDIAVFDMTGKMVQQISTTENEINVGENLTTGIYLVQIVQGQETKNIRVVKQ